MNTSTNRPSRLTWFLFLALLLIGSFGLFAEQATMRSRSDRQIASGSCANTPPSAAESQALLPTIPATYGGPSSAIPGGAPHLPDPDESQGLYGYSGPYYNTLRLDGQVLVLSQSIYTWPSSAWKVTGMVRNQTRCPIRITGITAHLLGGRGEVLATISASLPITELRPGEPAPFIAEGPISQKDVTSVDWYTDYAPDPSLAPKLLIFDVAENRSSQNGSRYDFAGTITNTASTTADVAVEVAWLNDQQQVIYVDAAKVRYISHPVPDWDTISMKSNQVDQFIYITTNTATATVLGAATDYAIWGVTK